MSSRTRRLITAAAATAAMSVSVATLVAAPALAYVSSPGFYCFDHQVTAQAPSEVSPASGNSQTVYWIPALVHWNGSGWEVQQWGVWAHRSVGDIYGNMYGWQSNGSESADTESFRVSPGYYGIWSFVYMDGAYQQADWATTDGTAWYCHM